jgi:hypothetical protein
MCTRFAAEAASVDRGAIGDLRQPLANLLGRHVVDAQGIELGVVVGRILAGDTVDLLVRRRCVLRRSRYLRLEGDAITVSSEGFVYHPHAVQLNALPAVARVAQHAGRVPPGDAA